MNGIINNHYGVWNEMPNELYIIGDIHGDFFALKQSLELTGCVIFSDYNDKIRINHNNEYFYFNDGCEYYSIDKNNVYWNEEKVNCFIVFSGDIIDRCRPNGNNNINCINTVNDENCDYLLLKLLFELDKQAKLYNSRVIVVLGNHELMNIQNYDYYVTLKGRHDKNRMENIKKYLHTNILNIYGIIRINKYIIVHGGINNTYFKNFNRNNYNIYYETIELFNYKLRNYILTNNSNFIIDIDNSPFWDRTLGGRGPLIENQCKEIFNDNLLNIVNFSSIKDQLKIIVAHCPQFSVQQTINLVNCQEYDNKIWRIDIGMSRAFDLYDIEKIKNILCNSNFVDIILSMNYIDFFIINDETEKRKVSCIKITDTEELILQGKLTIDYFYDLKIFNNKSLIFFHILSDLIKIFIDNYNISFNQIEQINYLSYIVKLKHVLFYNTE
jgi:hypothetical protein